MSALERIEELIDELQSASFDAGESHQKLRSSPWEISARQALIEAIKRALDKGGAG